MSSSTGLFRRLGLASDEGLVSDSAQNQTRSGLDVRVVKSYPGKGSAAFTLEANFQVSTGFTVLVGPSGTGKSTLLRCIAGLCDPDQGRIAVGDRVLFDSEQRLSIEPAQRRVAFVFQRLALFPHLTVEENVGYGLRQLPAKQREPRVSGILESFQIAHLRKHLPDAISGGERQRVALARSLVTEPSLLLLDEPLSSLDVGTKAGIVEDLRKWNELHHVPILYATHSHEEMFALGEQVIVFDPGGVMTDGLPLDVVSTPRRDSPASSADFENLMDVTVVGPRPSNGTMICRLGPNQIQIEVPPAYTPPGSEIQLSILSSEIFLASAEPELIGSWNLIPGKVSELNRVGVFVDAVVDCGINLRVRVSADSWEVLQASREVWVMIHPFSCHFVRIKRLRPLQRLVVFVCGGNTSRSPIAQAVCNSEIARRLRIPASALRMFPVRAVSAGLTAEPGTPVTEEAQRALQAIGIPRSSHRSQNLTSELAGEAEAIFCMTEKQRQQASAMFPLAAAKIHCLLPGVDLEDPSGGSPDVFLKLAKQLQELVGLRLAEFGVPERG
ncbi:MAG: ATP-binding cassette domain-containing protein [Candidatus Sulfotelmatobacter sp.]|jgi:molybdate transport system ATP-binding protein